MLPRFRKQNKQSRESVSCEQESLAPTSISRKSTMSPARAEIHRTFPPQQPKQSFFSDNHSQENFQLRFFSPALRLATSSAWRTGTANHTAEHISVLPRRIVTIATSYRLYLYNGDQKDMCYWCDIGVLEAAAAAAGKSRSDSRMQCFHQD